PVSLDAEHLHAARADFEDTQTSRHRQRDPCHPPRPVHVQNVPRAIMPASVVPTIGPNVTRAGCGALAPLGDAKNMVNPPPRSTKPATNVTVDAVAKSRAWFANERPPSVLHATPVQKAFAWSFFDLATEPSTRLVPTPTTPTTDAVT